MTEFEQQVVNALEDRVYVIMEMHEETHVMGPDDYLPRMVHGLVTEPGIFYTLTELKDKDEALRKKCMLRKEKHFSSKHIGPIRFYVTNKNDPRVSSWKN